MHKSYKSVHPLAIAVLSALLLIVHLIETLFELLIVAHFELSLKEAVYLAQVESTQVFAVAFQ